MMSETWTRSSFALLSLGFTIGCGASTEAGSGDLTVLLEAEDLIVSGLEPGDAPENVRDGWAIAFDRYLVTIGEIEARYSTDASLRAQAAETLIVDLTQIPAAGLPLWTLRDLKAGRWEFGYATPAAGGMTLRDDSVSDADFAEMQSMGWTYLVEGVLQKAGGESCPPSALATPPAGAIALGMNAGADRCYANPSVRFSFGAAAPARFFPCEIGGVPGFVITRDGTQTVAASIHGDHLFFNGFPEGAESGTMRLAQWLADCDLDLDGIVTQAELEAISPSALAELDGRYQLGGSPITPLEDMYQYLIAQLATQGHFQGEGECPLASFGS